MVDLADSGGRAMARGTGRGPRPAGVEALAARSVQGLSACVLTLLVSAGLLVACADRSLSVAVPPTAPVAKPKTLAPSLAETPIPRSKPSALARFGTTGPAETRPAAMAAALPLPLPRPTPQFDPHGLVGLTEQETLRLLGQPTDVEESPPAKTWRYAGDRCDLRVHLFMEMTTRSFRTLSYDLSSTDENPDVDQQHCLAELVAQAWRPGQQ